MLKSHQSDSVSSSDLLPRHDEIYWPRRVLEAVSIGTALTLVAIHIVRLTLTVSENLPWMLLAILAGFITADLVSGLVHWTADTWFSDTMPILGQRLLKPFRVHHVNPEDFLRRNVLDTNGDVAVIVIPFLMAVFWIPTANFWSAALAVYVVAFCTAGLPTNQVHQWAHMKQPTTIIRWLQCHSLILSRRAHQLHHRAPHVNNYCIALGWCNSFLTKADFFPRLERVITRLTGLQPRCDDQKYHAAVTAKVRLLSDVDGCDQPQPGERELVDPKSVSSGTGYVNG